MTTWMLGLIVKSTLLLAGVGVLALSVRRSSAATRHFVWLCGLSVLLLMPAFAAIAPAWSPSWAVEWLPEYLLDTPRDASQATSPFTIVIDEPLLSATAASEASPTESTALLAPQQLSTHFVTPAGVYRWALTRRVLRTPLPYAIAFVWVIGVMLMALRLAGGFVQRLRLSRNALRVEGGEYARATARAARDLGIRRPIHILLGDSKTVPMTWGIARPVLFLPAAADGWSPERLRAVLLHELAHIKRHDSLCRTLSQLACATFWFHPLAWYAARRMLREQERACDDVVILAGANPHHYAETLVAIAREFRSPVPAVAGALAFSRRSNLEHRLLSILDPLKRRQKMSFFRRLAMFATFVALVLPLAALHPSGVAQQTDGQQQDVSAKQRTRVAVAPNVAINARADVAAAPNIQSTPQANVTAAPNVQSAPRADVAAAPNIQSTPQANVTDAPAPNVQSNPRPDVVAAPNVQLSPPADVMDAPIPALGPQVAAGQEVRRDVRDRERTEVRREQEREDRQQIRVATRIREAFRIRIEVRGVNRLARDIDQVEVEDDGVLRMSEDDREVEVRAVPEGGTEITYRFAGEEAEFDAEAREWANNILERISDVEGLGGSVIMRIGGSDPEGEDEPVILSITTMPETIDLAIATSIDDLDLATELADLKLAVAATELAVDDLAITVAPVRIHDDSGRVVVEPKPIVALTIHPTRIDGLDEAITITELNLDEAISIAEFKLDEALTGPVRIEIVRPEISIPSDFGIESEIGGAWSLDLTRRWDRLVTWSDDGTRVIAMWRGEVAMAAQVNALELGPDGELAIDERAADGTHRRLHAFADEAGTIQFEWFVDGAETPFDDAGRAWLQPILEQLDNRDDR